MSEARLWQLAKLGSLPPATEMDALSRSNGFRSDLAKGRHGSAWWYRGHPSKALSISRIDHADAIAA